MPLAVFLLTGLPIWIVAAAALCGVAVLAALVLATRPHGTRYAIVACAALATGVVAQLVFTSAGGWSFGS